MLVDDAVGKECVKQGVSRVCRCEAPRERCEGTFRGRYGWGRGEDEAQLGGEDSSVENVAPEGKRTRWVHTRRRK